MNLSTQRPDSRDELPQINEAYWREALRQRPYYDPSRGFDRYRWALQYGLAARRRHGSEVEFTTVMEELASGWAQFGGPSGMNWGEAEGAVRDAWEQQHTLMAESIASKAGFKEPPTFTDNGQTVPRNLDEPNS
jgi:hypothetical protein